MRNILFGSITLAGLLALPALAETPDEGGKPEGRPGREEMRERVLKEFDKDGDGKLSDEERQKARETMRERYGRGGRDGRPRGEGKEGRKGNKKGDRGHGSDGWHGPHGHHPPGPPLPPPEELFSKFDLDNDEKLSLEEFQKLADFVRDRLPPPPPPGGPRHGPGYGGRGPDGPPPGGEGFRRRDRGPDRPGRPPRGEGRRDREDPKPPPRPDDNPDPPPSAEPAAEDSI